VGPTLMLPEEFKYLATIKTIVLFIFLSMYFIKLRWLLSLRLGKDLSTPKGDRNLGIRRSFMSNFTPWGMESSKSKPFGWFEFAFLHLGVGSAITASFLIPYFPALMVAPITQIFTIFAALGCLAALSRFVKRVVKPEIRVISSWDDYFSSLMVTVWLAVATVALLGNITALVAFMFITTGLLIYVPTSKISHYLYWPFTRYYFGAHFGRRGVIG